MLAAYFVIAVLRAEGRSSKHYFDHRTAICRMYDFFFFKIYLFILERDREGTSQGWVVRGRGRERI